ncbi:MAG: NAD(P)/FAD-dependent oxidoreductase [Bacteroidales bacterium]|nr:MAG: NAD(P)/FAD-dependent oxidoreductase [Bacteroidales bacterium]
MEKNILIVGAGISGLSAGCYAQMNGYKTTIFEMNSIPGGLCTAWERKGYTFDISMHMLTGSLSGPIHRMWQEMGIPQKFSFHYHDHISHVEGMGKTLTFSTDRKKLDEELLAISPGDADLIREFTRLIFGPDMMEAASLKPKVLKNIWDSVRMLFALLPLFRTFGKYNKMTIQEFSGRFKDPFLRKAIRFIVDTPGWPMLEFPMVALAGFIRSGVIEAGAPLGGSQQVVYHMAELYKQLGGEIQFKSRVKDLIIENNRVMGIKLEDDTRYTADQVIWAGDGHTLIYEILKGKYINDKIRNIYEKWIPVKPIVHVMMGVNRDLSKEPHRIIFEPDEPITIAGREYRWLTVIHHCFDKSMAPEGKSAVEVWYDSEYEYWEELYKNKTDYKVEKKRIADYTIQQLDKRWPGFASQVEVIDVPTPATYMRYTGNWKASPDGWYITPDNIGDDEPVRTLPGLEGLRMVGHWTAPFMGTVMSAMSGRQVIQLICKEEGKKFMTQAGL